MKMNQNRLKDLREDHDYTQQQIADAIGITAQIQLYRNRCPAADGRGVGVAGAVLRRQRGLPFG